MAQEKEPLVVWFVTDHKAGHRSQLLGLEQALAHRVQLDGHWLSVEHGWSEVWQQVRSPSLPAPEWVIGAGRLTHLPVALLKRRFSARALVTNKPHWPFFLFDRLALPRHDGVSPSAKLLLTEGALNPVLPAQNARADQGLMLVGGPSVHFGWDGDSLLRQIGDIVARESAVQWTLSTSRRTPVGFLEQVRALNLPHLTVLGVDDTERGWVAQQLDRCGTVWVGEDSVSMVYECLSAGAKVGLLSMPAKGESRVAQGIASLVERRWLTRFEDYIKRGYSEGRSEPLQEAARVAEWILQ